MAEQRSAKRVMADCVRDSLLDVARLLRDGAQTFEDKTGPEAARRIAKIITDGAERSHREIVAELEKEKA